jgi:hypothetical protein
MEGRWILTDLEYQINKLNNKLEAIEGDLSRLRDRRREVLESHDALIDERATIKAELKLLYAQRERVLSSSEPFS